MDSFYPNKFPPTSLNSIPLQHVITARHRFHLKGPTPKNKQKKKTHAPAHTHTHTFPALGYIQPVCFSCSSSCSLPLYYVWVELLRWLSNITGVGFCRDKLQGWFLLRDHNMSGGSWKWHSHGADSGCLLKEPPQQQQQQQPGWDSSGGSPPAAVSPSGCWGLVCLVRK